MKRLFFDKYGYLRLWVFLALIFAAIVSLFIGLNEYGRYQCRNYQQMTGRESTYVNFDSCYIKDVDGNIVRYDGNFKK